MLKKTILCILAMILIASNVYACGEEMTSITTEEVRMESGDDVIAYPQLSGMENQEIQKKINDDILLSANITKHYITLSTLKDSLWGLQVTYQEYLQNDIYSVLISAYGKMPNNREGHAYTALSYDLTTGERLTLNDLFTDVQNAVEVMEGIAVATLSDELSSYMDNSEITPLPVDSFAIDQDGITFYYPSDQFGLLSGYSGACQFYYEELAGLLREDEQGVAARIGVLPQKYTASETKKLVEESVSSGELLHVPAKLDESMTALIDQYRLVRTPDAFPGGRYYLIESPQFRQVLIISDSIEAGYDRSVIEGIQLKRGSLYGLVIGETNQSRWHEILGDPDQIITFTENMAYDYNLPVGQSDLYHYGTYELRLHSNEEGVLASIQINK